MTSNIPTYTIKATIKTPIHIWSGEEYDRLDYFVFKDENKLKKDENKLKIVDQKWLEDLAGKDEKLFTNILDSIKEGDFKKLEQLKNECYSKFLSNSSVYEIEEINVEKKAYEYLIQDKEYKKTQVRGNQ